MARGLSKSKIMDWRQCPKNLYMKVNRSEPLAISPDLQQRFDTGHAVGELAQDSYPGGVVIEPPGGLGDALTETTSWMDKDDHPALFEATFSSEGVLIRADILQKSPDGLRLVEVKSSASVKDYHIVDCAVQTWVIENAGYPVSHIYLAHIDSSFVYKTEGDYSGLIVEEEITEEVRALIPEVSRWVKGAFETLDGDMPDIEPGKQCKKPYECAFFDVCNPAVAGYPVTCLPHGGKVVDGLLNEGITDIRDIPVGQLTNDNHERVRRVTVAGKAELGPEAAGAIKDLEYPRYYFDFETIGFTIPQWIGTRPFQQIPFQWSCHIDNGTGEMKHEEFLSTDGNDPRPGCAKAIDEVLGDAGPVIAYNAGFEKGVLGSLRDACPDYAARMDNVIDRLFDLLPVARKYYYHPDMLGSWSMKAVLPTILPELDYSLLDEVQDGGGAQNAYLECIKSDTPEERIDELRAKLIKYCKQDTQGMIEIADYFEGK